MEKNEIRDKELKKDLSLELYKSLRGEVNRAGFQPLWALTPPDGPAPAFTSKRGRPEKPGERSPQSTRPAARAG